MNYLFLIIVLVIVIAVLVIASFTNFALDDEHYDRLKWIVIRWSYLVTFIALIVKTFNISYGIETVTIVAGIGAMLAGLLGVSKDNYHADDVQTEFNASSLEEMMGDNYEAEEEPTEE